MNLRINYTSSFNEKKNCTKHSIPYALNTPIQCLRPNIAENRAKFSLSRINGGYGENYF